MSEKLLVGKNAVITGCARGIGASILERFAQHGANVWACVRQINDQVTESCGALADRYGVRVMPLSFDITNREEVKQAVRIIAKSDLPINTLVNNAGISYNALHQMTTEAILREQMEVNFFAPFLLTQQLVKLMLRHTPGTIVTLSSVVALDANLGRAAYGASKAAILCATRALSREVATMGIRANVIAPGVTQTDMIRDMKEEIIAEVVLGTDMRRMGEPVDIADVAVFLASDLSSYMTGQVLRVDGGVHAL